MSNIRVRIRLSGALAQMCGFEEKTFELPEGSTVGDAVDTAIIDENTRGLCIAILNGLEVDLDSVLRERDFLLLTMFTVISGG
jgi:hypothetical protein